MDQGFLGFLGLPATISRWLTTSMGTMTDCVTNEATAPAKKFERPAVAASLGDTRAAASRLQLFVASRVDRYTCGNIIFLTAL